MDTAADENAAAAATTAIASPSTPVRCKPLLHYKELSLGALNKKVKFTCVHASDNFLVCGANNGSVYLYVTSGNRTDVSADAKRVFPSKYHLVKTIAPPPSATNNGNSDRASVSCLSICPVQKRLVVGTLGGVVFGMQLTDYNKIGERVEFTHDFHAGFPVTCFLWDKLGMKLYSACNGGMVALTTLRAGMSAFFGKADTELLLKEETGVVQLDMTKYGRADILMVSSQMRVLLLNLTSADGSAVQIGTKARQGNFGACFFTSAADESEIAKKTNVKVFSARPGRRVWVADPQTGTVSATLKFSLGKTPTAFLQSPECRTDESIQARDLTINKMALFQFIYDPYAAESSSGGAGLERSLLVSWNTGSSVVFFLDPIAVEIVEWHLDLGTIHDLKVLNESVLLVLHGDTPKVSVVQSCSARQFLDLYAGDDVRKAVEMAVTYQMNDLAVVDALQTQWKKLTEKSSAPDNTVEKLTTQLAALHANATELEELHRVPDLSAAANAAPLQIIFKQRPQQQGQPQPQGQQSQAPSASTFPDLFDSSGGGSKAANATAPTPSDYLDLRPSPLSYRRNIYAPDGSTLEARMIDIKELPATEPIVRDDYRESWMDEIMDEVRKFEALKAQHDGAMMNNLLPTLRGTLNHTGAAAKAITTYIPGANMISNFMDTATNVNNYSGLAAGFGGGGGMGGGMGGMGGIFGDLPDASDAIILDPIVFTPKHRPRTAIDTNDAIGDHDAHECAVLRIAMSYTGEAAETKLDSEVLLEAISMDIWDSKLKYISNLPLDKQLSLPDAPMEIDMDDDAKQATAAHTHPRESVLRPIAEKKSPMRKSKSAESLMVMAAAAVPALELSLLAPMGPDDSGSQSMTASLAPRRPLVLTRRSSMSPDAGRSTQRALQRFIGGGPSCDFQRKCLVSGQLASSPELDSILKREVSDLLSELNAAAATAEKTASLTKRLWPAAGITRVCACLANMYLLEGELTQAQNAIRLWLKCFDPRATAESKSPSVPKPKNKNGSARPPQGFARGEALIDGDGLPLTRSDWTLVRTMVSTFFAISACGDGAAALYVRAAMPQDYGSSDGKVRPYAYEMGIILEIGELTASSSSQQCWSPKEADEFVMRYGIYLNTELAAEVCNKRQLGNTLNAVLDQVVSSSSMSSTCDDVVNWIVEKQIGKALECLKEMDSICLLLHVLDLLLKKCPDDAIELCVAKFPAMSPWNVERCLFGAPSSASIAVKELLKPVNVPQTATYFRYLVRLLDEHSQVVGQDQALVDRCIALCFGGAKVVGQAFHKDKTARRKHSGGDDVVSWVCSLLRRPELFKYDHNTAWEICVKNHVHTGLLELTYQSLLCSSSSSPLSANSLANERLDHLIHVIMATKELLILEELLARGATLPEELASHVVHKVLAQIESVAEKGDDELITTVVHALLNAVGPASGMQLLSRFPLLFAASPLDMYQTIVEAHLLSERQQDEVTRMLETMDTHVWAAYKQASKKASVSFAPQLQAVFELECGALRAPLDDTKFEKWQTKHAKYQAELRQATRNHNNGDPVDEKNHDDDHDHDSRDITMRASMLRANDWTTSAATARYVTRSFEFRSSDWGGDVQLHDATCAVCDLPVVMIADDNCSMEVALLPCGHAFHSVCATDAACSVCFENNLQSLVVLDNGW